jgi:hypothetical protein
MRNELDLIQALDLPQLVVRDLISNVCRAVSPSCASVCLPAGLCPIHPARVGSRQLVRGLLGQALDLVDRKSGALHTTLPALDSALHGGLPPSSITEVPLLPPPPSRTAHTKLTCATGGRTGRSREDAVLPPDGGPGLPARGGGRPRRVRGLHRYRSRVQPQTVHSRPCRCCYASLSFAAHCFDLTHMAD